MDRHSAFSWAMVAGTILLTTYAQVALKWQVRMAGNLPDDLSGKWGYLISSLLNPWVLSGLIAAFGAALCWIMALPRFSLSYAYPFTALSIVLVVIAGRLFFCESISATQLLGIVLIISGVVLLSFQ